MTLWGQCPRCTWLSLETLLTQFDRQTAIKIAKRSWGWILDYSRNWNAGTHICTGITIPLTFLFFKGLSKTLLLYQTVAVKLYNLKLSSAIFSQNSKNANYESPATLLVFICGQRDHRGARECVTPWIGRPGARIRTEGPFIGKRKSFPEKVRLPTQLNTSKHCPSTDDTYTACNPTHPWALVGSI